MTVPHYQSGSKQAASARDFLPQRRTLASLRAAARCCKGCDLYRNASQTVFGEGPTRYDGKVVPGEDPLGRKLFWFTVVPIEGTDEGTDRWAVEHGYVSMTS